MTTKLDKLIVQLDADNSQLRKKLGDSNKNLDLFAKKGAKSMDVFKKAAVAAFGVFGVVKIAGAIKGTLEFADSIDKAAKAAGVGAQFLQEMRFAGDQTGISMIGLDDSMRRFNRRLGEFINSGGGPAKAAFESLNIAVRDVKGNVRSTEDVFRDAVKGMNTLATTAQRSAIAAQIFGDDFGPKLVTLLDLGVDGIERLRQAARDAGAVLTDEMVQSAVDAKDAMAKLDFASEGLWNQLVVHLTPALKDAANWMTEFIVSMGNAPRAIADIEADLARLENRLSRGTGTRRGRRGPTQGQADELREELLLALTGSSDPKEIERAAKLINEQIRKLTEEQGAIPESQRQRSGRGRSNAGVVTRFERINKELKILVEQRKSILEKASEITAPKIVNQDADGVGAGDADFLKKEAGRALKRQLALQKANDTFAERRKNNLQKGVDDLVRSLDTELQAENRRHRESLELLITANDDEIKIEGGFLNAKEKLNQDHQQRLKAINDSVADDGVAAFDELKSAVNGWGRDFADELLDAEGNFGDFADSIVRQLARIAIAQATQPAFDAFGSFIGSAVSSFLPGFAHGGRAPGGPIIVGERGPEIVSPPAGSRVTPNSALGGVINVYNSFDFTNANPATIQLLRQEARNIRNSTIDVFRDMKSRGDLPEFA